MYAVDNNASNSKMWTAAGGKPARRRRTGMQLAHAMQRFCLADDDWNVSTSPQTRAEIFYSKTANTHLLVA